MKRKIIETLAFSREVSSLLAKNKVLKKDFDTLKRKLVETPKKGVLLSGTGGIRKIRLKSSSKGQSGGFRLCYFYYSPDEEIFLLFIFQKNQQENLSREQKNQLKKLANKIKGRN